MAQIRGLAGRIGSWTEPTLDRVGRTPLWLKLALTTAVAASVGYLIEYAILNGWRAVWTAPTSRLSWLAIVGLILLATFWVAAQMAGALRGYFVHIEALADESWAHRRDVEDLLLRNWVTDQWPRAIVLAPVRGPTRSIADARAIARRTVESARCARALAPAARRATVLLGARQDLSVALGALLADALPRRVRLLADVSDASDPTLGRRLRARHTGYAIPFHDFRVPDADATPRPGPTPGGGTAVVAVLLQPAHEAVVRSSLGSVASSDEHLVVVPTSGLTHAADLGEHRQLREDPRAYEELLTGIHATLKQLATTHSGVLIVTDAPASIAFGAGLLAAREGLSVWTAEHSLGTYRAPVEVGPPLPPAESTPAAATRSWYTTLLRTSGLAALAFPFLMGSIGTLLEWVLAESGSSPAAVSGPDPVWLGRTADQWAWLLAILLISGLVCWSSLAQQSRLLDVPAFRLRRGPEDPPDPASLAVRWVRAPNLDRDAFADWVKARLRDIHYAFPGVSDIQIDVGTIIDPVAFVEDLVRSHRGNRPPVATICGQTVALQPGAGEMLRLALPEFEIALKWQAPPRPGSTMPARITDIARPAGTVTGIPVNEVSFGDPVGLPAPEPGTYLLVSRVLAAALPERRDLLFPFEEIRGEAGQIEAVGSLARVRPGQPQAQEPGPN